MCISYLQHARLDKCEALKERQVKVQGKGMTLVYILETGVRTSMAESVTDRQWGDRTFMICINDAKDIMGLALVPPDEDS